MPNDAIIFYRQAKALNELLSGGRIDKISMPSANIIELYIRSRGSNHCLLLSAEPSRSRIQLTRSPLPTLPSAPSFLMHLRKHIGNGKIVSVENIKYERIVSIKILKSDEMLYASEKQLIIEVLGKYSNIILLNSDGKISESVRHIPLDATSKRQILPGMKYTLPEAQNKFLPTDRAKLIKLLNEFDGSGLYNYLMNYLAGFSPVSVKEAIYRVLGAKDYSGKLSEESAERLMEELNNLYEESPLPCVYYDNETVKDFSASLYESLGNYKTCSSVDEAMDIYFSSSGVKQEINPEKIKLTTEIHHAINKASKRLANLKVKELENQDFESARIKGELLLANIYRIPIGTEEITLENYYDGGDITITLDKQKSPQQNAQAYYKKYSKMKKTVEMCALQIEKTVQDLENFDQLLLNISLCRTPTELDEIYIEAEKLGFGTKKQRNKKKNEQSLPLKTIIDEYEILIGKNSIQNERITKAAKPEDIWLHASKIPGSHVIIKNFSGAVPDSVIEKAARYCAYFSKAGSSDKVPVDYTFKKYVSKPSDAPIGKVIYKNQKTIYVSPLKPEQY